METVPRIDLILARERSDVDAVRALFMEYADYLKEDLCFQSFEEEIRTFPAFYSFLLLARVDGDAAAAVGLKDLGDGACEMKRLYAVPQHRGLKLGERLCLRLIEEARRRGYRVMRLDTLKRLAHALALYRKLGFAETAAYYENPLAEVVFMELQLAV